MKSFSAKYFPDLNEFEQQYNDIWFNNMLNMLTDSGQLIYQQSTWKKYSNTFEKNFLQLKEFHVMQCR